MNQNNSLSLILCYECALPYFLIHKQSNYNRVRDLCLFFGGSCKIYNINQAKIRFLTHADDDFYLFDGPYDFQFSRGMEVVALLS